MIVIVRFCCFITDDEGDLATGSDPAVGSSAVVYRPYGEIVRTHLDGPDSFHFKFNQQEEDAEASLYFYKSRYYDPVLGRFLQPDVVADTRAAQGMNAYMYVNGNPVRYRDPSGNINVSQMFGAIVKDMLGGLKWAARGIDHGTRTVVSGGTFQNNRGNDLGVVGRKFVEAGNFIGRILRKPEYLWGILVGTVDYVAATLAGNKPNIVYSKGTFGITNSYLTGDKIDDVSYAVSGVVHLKKGASRETFLHEFSHADMFFHGGRQSSVLLNEIATDLRVGTARYASTRYLLLRTLPLEANRLIALNSAILNPSGFEFISTMRFFNAVQNYNPYDNSTIDDNEYNFAEFLLFVMTWSEYYDKEVIN